MGQSPEIDIKDTLDNFSFSTYYCLAPEIISNNKSELFYTDVWACGILLYLMLSGTHPFKATNSKEFCELVVKKQVDFNGKEWRQISTKAKQIIKGMLQKKPTKRLSLLELGVHKWLKKYCNPLTKPKRICI